jgi:hypothetical protein
MNFWNMTIRSTPVATRRGTRAVRMDGDPHKDPLPNIALRLRAMHQKQSWFSIPTRVMLSFSNTQRISRPKCFSFYPMSALRNLR